MCAMIKWNMYQKLEFETYIKLINYRRNTEEFIDTSEKLIDKFLKQILNMNLNSNFSGTLLNLERNKP